MEGDAPEEDVGEDVEFHDAMEEAIHQDADHVNQIDANNIADIEEHNNEPPPNEDAEAVYTENAGVGVKNTENTGVNAVYNEDNNINNAELMEPSRTRSGRVIRKSTLQGRSFEPNENRYNFITDSNDKQDNGTH